MLLGTELVLVPLQAQRRRTMHEQGSPSEGAWACVVCKRQNEPTSNSCWVCYTARYIGALAAGWPFVW